MNWKITLSFVLVGLMIAFAVPASAQWSQAVLQGVCTGTANDQVGNSALALDNQGKLHLIYNEISGDINNLYYKSKPSGGTWSAPVQLGNPMYSQMQGCITVNKVTGIPYVVYMQNNIFTLAVGGTSWTYHTLFLPNIYTMVGSPAVAMDPMGNVHSAVIMMTLGGVYHILYVLWDGNLFTFHVLDGSDLGPFGSGAAPAIAAISNGGAVISYRAGDYGTYRIDVAENGTLGGTSWVYTSLQATEYNNFTSSVKVTSNDDLYLAMDGNMGWGFPGHVFFCTKAAGQTSWSLPMDVTGSNTGMDCRLAVQSNGTAHIVWQKTSGNFYTGDIVYATNLTGSWASQILQSGEDYKPSIVLDASGNGSLSFYHTVELGNNDVYYYGYVAPVLPPPQNVDITLTPVNPPIVIPPGGGSFGYGISLTNNNTSPQSFQTWTKVRLPNGSFYGPLAGPVLINNMSPGITLNRQRTQSVPGSAPAGTYTYCGYVGVYPSVVTDSSSFTFTKSAAGISDPEIGDWSCDGEPFPTGSETVSSQQPAVRITEATPNPFNPTTAISYQLQAPNQVSLKVYDTAGRLVATLVDGMQEGGQHSATFDGSRLASGMYFVKMQAGSFSAVQKLMLLK